MTATDELVAYMAEHKATLERIADQAPPPPADGIAILHATGCPVVRRRPVLKAAS